jgi:hypothetical protein
LLNPPSGAGIDASGVITWTPTEAQGPGTNIITSVVTDDATPALSATNSFTVIVQEFNTPPILPFQADRTLTGLTTLTVTNTATDTDLPANPLTYVLATGPSNAVISANGVITWTPVAAQVPSTNLFTTVVTDSSPFAVNAQSLSATNSFTVVVQSGSLAPVILSVVLSNSTVTLTWSAVEGSHYRVQYQQNAEQSNWSDLAGVITATGATATAMDPLATADRRFYRVVLVP